MPTATSSPKTDFINQASAAGANAAVADMLWSLRTDALTTLTVAAVDQFFVNLFSRPSLVQLFNQTQSSGAVRHVVYQNSSVGRSAYSSGERSQQNSVTWLNQSGAWTIQSVRAVLTAGSTPLVPDGTIMLGSDLFQGTPNYLGTEGALYVVAHELGHALNAFTFDAEISAKINDGFTYLSQQQAAINALPPADQAGKKIDITAQLANVLDVAAREEGHGNLIAYNIWADEFRASHGRLPTDADRMEVFRSTGYYVYVFGADGTFPPGLTTDPVTGQISDTSNNRDILGGRNLDLQVGLPGSHQEVYLADALSFFIAHASNAPLEFNAQSLGFLETGKTFRSVLENWVRPKTVGTATIVDTSNPNAPEQYTLRGVEKDGQLRLEVQSPPNPSTPEVKQNLFISLGVQDGSGVVFDRSSIEISLLDDGTLRITLSDHAGTQLDVSEADFEKQFGVSARSILAQDGAEEASLHAFTLDRNATTNETSIRFSDPGKYIPDGISLVRSGDYIVPIDSKGREATYVYKNGVLVAYTVSEGGVQVVTTLDSHRRPIATDIRINNNPVGIEFSDFGSVLGQQLGYRLAGGDALAGVLYSAGLKTLGDNLGDILDGIVGGESIKHTVDDAFATTGQEFLSNLKSAGIGALSSFLTAELVNLLGIHGTAGELANAAAGTVIGQIAQNIFNGADLLSGINPATIGAAVGSVLGNKLANEVISFDTVGGQIGASVGSALAVIGVSILAGGPIGLVPALVVSFIGNIVGGLIGSIFGGTPRSGADSVWDASRQQFVVANVWSRKGGSKDAARSVASAVSDTFNAVLSATGGTLLNPERVEAGNYGMRKKDFVYKPYSTQDSSAITQRFSGKDAATRLIGYGVYTGLTDPDFKIAGGDIYVKRALYNTFVIGGLDPRNFDTSVLLGNIASAQQYESYLANATVINALVAAEPNSVFAIETLLTLARADELGLTRRAASDWFGGFTWLMGEADTNAANVEFGFDYDPYSGQISRLIGVGDYVMGHYGDSALNSLSILGRAWRVGGCGQGWPRRGQGRRWSRAGVRWSPICATPRTVGRPRPIAAARQSPGRVPAPARYA